MSKKRPLILAVNDDGITAPGIQAMVEAAQELAEVVVVAPDSPQSGMGHAITLNKPLRLDKVSYHGESIGYQCSGTPVDCVKIAIDKILDRKPDLVISGINHGANHSINVIYSGTMSAAMEGAIEGIPSVGFSLLNYALDADFTASKHFVKLIIKNLLKEGLPKGTLLNVNVPDLPLNEIKGVKICRQANAKWEEEFDERMDPHNRKYFWLTGAFANYDKGEDTDVWALNNGYVSVVPVQFDLTAHHAIQHLNEWDLE
ncbi:MAG: 5'/3'-nucleotidase SurE [Flavobacteriales bacterium]